MSDIFSWSRRPEHDGADAGATVRDEAVELSASYPFVSDIFSWSRRPEHDGADAGATVMMSDRSGPIRAAEQAPAREPQRQARRRLGRLFGN